MGITVMQAVLLGLVSCLAGINMSPTGTTIGNYGLSRPLIASLFVGLILNDVPGVILIAVPVQLMFIAMITPGGAMLADLRSVSYIALPLTYVLSYHWGVIPGSTISQFLSAPIAVVIGILGVAQYNLTNKLNEIWQTKGWKEINQGNLNVLNATQTWMPWISHLVGSFIPVFVCTFFGSMLIRYLPLVSFDSMVMKAILSIGMVLPVVGIAIVLNAAVTKPTELILFTAGFILGAYLRLPILACAMIGAVIAWLDYRIHESKQVPSAENEVDEEDI